MPPSIIVAIVLVFMAGWVKGFSGFGFSMIVVLSLSLILAPSVVVPMVLLLEVCGSLFMLPRIWKQVHWRSLVWLLLGVVAGTPLGVYLLGNVPADVMRLGISLLCMSLVALMWGGYRIKRMLAAPHITAAGACCGLLNGASAMGGPPAILFYYGGPVGVTSSRASLLAFFLCTDSLAISLAGVHGLVTADVLKMGAFTIGPMLLGIILGSRFFSALAPDRTRHWVLLVLFLLALAVLVRSLWDYSIL